MARSKTRTKKKASMARKRASWVAAAPTVPLDEAQALYMAVARALAPLNDGIVPGPPGYIDNLFYLLTHYLSACDGYGPQVKRLEALRTQVGARMYGEGTAVEATILYGDRLLTTYERFAKICKTAMDLRARKLVTDEAVSQAAAALPDALPLAHSQGRPKKGLKARYTHARVWIGVETKRTAVAAALKAIEAEIAKGRGPEQLTPSKVANALLAKLRDTTSEQNDREMRALRRLKSEE